jgi:hypothetical protein
MKIIEVKACRHKKGNSITMCGFLAYCQCTLNKDINVGPYIGKETAAPKECPMREGVLFKIVEE